MNVPGNRTKLLPENHTIVTLYALAEKQLKGNKEFIVYGIVEVHDRYLQIFHSTGDIMFTNKFLEESGRSE